tara:strand:- start:776 stop:1126 length:351 start_codon:yes stop_codon:yes gene_type:complete
MDTQPIESGANPKVQTSAKAKPSSINTNSNSNSSNPVDAPEDPVSLSKRAQGLVPPIGVEEPLLNSDRKEFSVTDNNDVVIKVIDPETQEVVKTVPSEEEIQLRNAIREGIDEIIE